MSSSYTNRPWAMTITSAIDRAMASVKDVDQVHKLARNYIASLDLGCPNLKMVNEVDHRTYIEGLNGRERYLLWVKNWKLFYNRLSPLIRKYRANYGRHDQNTLRLKETAQVMLNARYNAKLASWSIKMRRHTNQK